ncbi:uncharacterized protein N7459_009889 [Penicillium hispanicum]|uniref:uncharacterized protein n=1 Tax=Penicillium hispanicum TaxID=1080232 RepID=UPI00253FF1D9|nr:uncharacterized protein N7459_009889 [Penicillium hispanicum]KAJ5570459.1 hypothetical protein N7459_009889 [Penicillium hispanicum]
MGCERAFAPGNGLELEVLATGSPWSKTGIRTSATFCFACIAPVMLQLPVLLPIPRCIRRESLAAHRHMLSPGSTKKSSDAASRPIGGARASWNAGNASPVHIITVPACYERALCPRLTLKVRSAAHALNRETPPSLSGWNHGTRAVYILYYYTLLYCHLWM